MRMRAPLMPVVAMLPPLARWDESGCRSGILPLRAGTCETVTPPERSKMPHLLGPSTPAEGHKKQAYDNPNDENAHADLNQKPSLVSEQPHDKAASERQEPQHHKGGPRSPPNLI